MDDLVYAPFGSGGGDPPPVGEIPEPATSAADRDWG
jgi:hypothetical protein